MFKISEKTELNQISLTGIRALIFMGLLITKPCSLEEIRKTLIDLKIMDESHSDDILRIDLSTIKTMGCEISRPSSKTQYKYVLTKHPFAFKIPEEELAILKKVYNHTKAKVDLKTLIEYDELFKKIALHICDENTKEAVLGVSALRYFDLQLIKDLMIDCKHNRVLELEYQKNSEDKVSKKQIIAQEIVYKNDKIYLYGYDLKKNKSIVLNFKRIISILSRNIQKNPIEPNQIKIKYILKNTEKDCLETNEEIIENIENGFIVEGFYHNEFLATQRILYFGTKCTVLEPIDFKNTIIAKIKEMRKVYEHEPNC